MQPRKCSILFAGGGTGGHLFPALAIADEIKRIRPDAHITFVGTRDKIEARVVPTRGYAFASMWISGFRRGRTLENILFPVKLVVSLAQSFLLIKKLKPNVVVGTGGYVCGPVVFVASMIGVPTLLQEQNSYPGVTTRLLSSRVDEVHVSFESSAQHLSTKTRIRVTGNPTRSAIGTISRVEGAKFFGLDMGRKTILVFGGSLGASSINQAVVQILPALCTRGLQVLWQTGEKDYEQVQAAVEHAVPVTGTVVKVYKFINEMEFAYAAADLAVCRAGATTVAELTRAGMPAVLVPYPYAAADHQTDNARALADNGAAIIILDSQLQERLLSTVTELLADISRLNAMAEKARALGKPNAAVALAEAVINLAKRYDV